MSDKEVLGALTADESVVAAQREMTGQPDYLQLLRDQGLLRPEFKGAATRAAATVGPFQKFYEARIASGMKPPMARLTLARKIAAITLLVWKKGVRFDAKQLKQQAA